jgi:heptose-I-phosphate ethanolaminephosphotransferase
MYKEISVIKLMEEYANYKKEIDFLNNIGQNKTDLKISLKTIKVPETYIFIVGESTSKYHMQLYGYQRATNPELQKLKKELALFHNVKSKHVHTVESLKDIFVLTDQNNSFTSATLIDCFNQAGFSTFWLSNQYFLGENETPIGAIAKNTSQQVYINTSNASSLDGELLPELEKILKKKKSKKVIFVHLMGAHLNYPNRYPNEYNKFIEKNISIFGKHADSYINQYDNAILYNDYVVSEIIKRAKKVEGLAAVTYFSDHGDEVYDFRNFHGHSGAMQSKYMTSVPFFVWGNEAFKADKEKQLSTVKNNVNRSFYLKNFSHTAQDLFGVQSIYYQQDKSFFSQQDSLVTISEIKQVSIQNTDSNVSPFDSKIWVHRVNSLERLAKIEPLFKGMELDVVFENGKFDVRHPPAKSINLSLEKYLTNIKNPSAHYFWIDLKNLNIKNVEEINQRLNYLAQKFKVKENIIVETTNPETIPVINSFGYFSSYYLPGLSNLNEFELIDALVTVNENITISEPKSISQSFDNYYIMKENFGAQNKLIWALNLNWNDSSSHERIEGLLQKDKTIKVCLVNYTTEGWR